MNDLVNVIWKKKLKIVKFISFQNLVKKLPVVTPGSIALAAASKHCLPFLQATFMHSISSSFKTLIEVFPVKKKIVFLLITGSFNISNDFLYLFLSLRITIFPMDDLHNPVGEYFQARFSYLTMETVSICQCTQNLDKDCIPMKKALLR